MQNTANYNLNKPDGNDYVMIEVLNANTDIIDEELKNVVRHVDYAVASGTNTYAATIDSVDELVEGMSLKIKFTNANTGASTLNINDLGAISIQRGNGDALVSGNIKANQILHLVYNGSNFQILGEGGSGNAQPEDVKAGKTFTNDDGEQVGVGEGDFYKFNPGDTTVYILSGNFNIPANTTSFQKFQEVRVKLPGIVRVSFALRSAGTTQTQARIFKNGFAVGTTRTKTDDSWTTYVEDVAVEKDDLLQLYARNMDTVNTSQYGAFQVKLDISDLVSRNI